MNNVDKKHKNINFRNNLHVIGGYTPMSAYGSYSKKIPKNYNAIISLNKKDHNNLKNINYLNLSNVNNNSLEISEHNKFSPLSKNIFISKLNLKSNRKEKKIKYDKYKKKWDLPKSFSFEKISGRQKHSKNPIKLQKLERLFEYKPNYDSILCNENKAYVKYNNNFKKDFKTIKINSHRKYICNWSNIMNNPGNNYNIINVLNKQKEIQQKKIEDNKIIKILEEYIDYNKKMNEYI